MLDNILFSFTHGLLYLLIRFYFRIDIRGGEYLPERGPFLVVSNHSSHLDTGVMFFLMGKHKCQLMAFAAEDYFFSNRFIIFLVTRLFNAVAVNRQKFSPEILETARELSSQGRILLLYPEGGRTEGPAIRPFKSGMAYLARELALPVIPVSITGTDKAYPKGAFWPRPYPIQVNIAPPQFFEGEATAAEGGNQQLKEFTSTVENTIRTMAQPAHWALVTGASSGNGAEISRYLAELGYRLVLVGRDQARLEEVAGLCRKHGRDCLTFAMDLTRTDERNRLLSSLTEKDLEIGFLVNNAGIGSVGDFTETHEALIHYIVELNVQAVLDLTRALLPAMLERNRGHIVNVASVYGVVPVPKQAVYGASKAFVSYWTRALQRELKQSGVCVTLALPGSFDSRFHVNAGVSEARPLKKSPAVFVARKIVDGALNKRRTVVPGWINYLFVVFCQCVPLGVSARLIEAINGFRKLTRQPSEQD